MERTRINIDMAIITIIVDIDCSSFIATYVFPVKSVVVRLVALFRSLTAVDGMGDVII